MTSTEDFQAYAQIKAYDVISAGHFKRHLSTSRDNGDKWAIDMYQSHNQVQVKVRDIFTLVGHLSTPNSQVIQRICKDVMSCAQPPIKVLTGHNICCLTGVSTEHCIDLTRVGKHSSEMFVHPRFWHFFVLLWFCTKLEYVVRACTKQWLDKSCIIANPGNYTQICEEYAFQNLEFNEQLSRLFCKGVDYITRSLTTYRDKIALIPVLTPQEGYLNDEDEDDD